MVGDVVGVDVGGTFTDMFFLDEVDGTCEVVKVPTTRDDQSRGIQQGIDRTLGGLADVVLRPSEDRRREISGECVL